MDMVPRKHTFRDTPFDTTNSETETNTNPTSNKFKDKKFTDKNTSLNNFNTRFHGVQRTPVIIDKIVRTRRIQGSSLRTRRLTREIGMMPAMMNCSTSSSFAPGFSSVCTQTSLNRKKKERCSGNEVGRKHMTRQ